jgi:small subunit ribosomal protein S17
MAKTLVGIVSSDKPDKTIVVKVERRKTHPIYRKQFKVTNKFMVHDEKNEARAGDKVAIIECPPLSAKKRFKLDKIIEKPALREESLVATKVEEPVKQSKEKANEEVKE